MLTKKTAHYINPEGLPDHRHDAAFWESLGHVVATFGFLEEVLKKAIFSLTVTRRYKESEIHQAYMDWLPTLEHTLTDPLGDLIKIMEMRFGITRMLKSIISMT